jgi:Cytochrome P450.
MFSLMNECAEELRNFLEGPASRNEDLEVKEIMSKFTTDIIGSCVFGLKCNSIKDPNSEFRTMGRKVVEPSLNTVIRLMLGILVPKLGIRILPWEVTQFFISAVRDTIQYREQHNIVRNDFMQQLIQLKNEGQVRDDDEVDKADLKKEVSTNGTSSSEKNKSNMAESIGEYTYLCVVHTPIRDIIFLAIKLHFMMILSIKHKASVTSHLIISTFRR